MVFDFVAPASNLTTERQENSNGCGRGIRVKRDDPRNPRLTEDPGS